jgi:hypothetical protein
MRASITHALLHVTTGGQTAIMKIQAGQNTKYKIVMMRISPHATKSEEHANHFT